MKPCDMTCVLCIGESYFWMVDLEDRSKPTIQKKESSSLLED